MIRPLPTIACVHLGPWPLTLLAERHPGVPADVLNERRRVLHATPDALAAGVTSGGILYILGVMAPLHPPSRGPAPQGLHQAPSMPRRHPPHSGHHDHGPPARHQARWRTHSPRATEVCDLPQTRP